VPEPFGGDDDGLDFALFFGMRVPSYVHPIAVALAGAAVGFWTVRRATRFDLSGRVVVITGGSRGLGLLLAREVGDRGGRVVLLARDASELSRARQEMRDRGVDVLALPCDVTNRREVSEAIATAIAWYGRIDVLVNNAGAIMVGPLGSHGAADFGTAMATHFWAPFHAVQEVLPVMKAQGGGRIANISSIGGIAAVPHLSAYAASKFALAGFSEALGVELAREGIVVTSVFPGLMRTGSARAALLKGDAEVEDRLFRASSVMPGFSISGRRAARRIVRAIERGEAHVVVGTPAKVIALAHGLMPGLFARTMRALARVLPAAPAGGTTKTTRGSAFDPPRGWLGRRDQRLAEKNNETIYGVGARV
jgi:short-subunit dehydrogenase